MTTTRKLVFLFVAPLAFCSRVMAVPTASRSAVEPPSWKSFGASLGTRSTGVARSRGLSTELWNMKVLRKVLCPADFALRWTVSSWWLKTRTTWALMRLIEPLRSTTKAMWLTRSGFLTAMGIPRGDAVELRVCENNLPADDLRLHLL